MRKLFVCIFLIWGCTNNRTTHEESEAITIPNSKVVSLSLTDSLGKLILVVPVGYDTSFAWFHYSDWGRPCNYQKYRFQPKTPPFPKKGAWLWKEFLKS